MKLQSVDADLYKLAAMVEECSDLAQKKDHRFLEYLLGMVRMELDNIAAHPPSETGGNERQLESV